MLKFLISDAQGSVTPTAAKVVITKPDNTSLDEVDATIDGNEVSYIVPIEATDMAGRYTAYFVLALPNIGIRTHSIDFVVGVNPEKR